MRQARSARPKLTSRRPLPLLPEPFNKRAGLLLADFYQLGTKILAALQLVDGVREGPRQIASEGLVHRATRGMATPNEPGRVLDRPVHSHDRIVRNLLWHFLSSFRLVRNEFQRSWRYTYK